MKPKIKPILFAAALLVVMVLATVSTTGALLRQQIRFGVGGRWVLLLLQSNPQYSVTERFSSVGYANRSPHSFSLQFAAAMQDTSTSEESHYDSDRPDEALLARLADLQSRFPNEPAAIAAYLRYASKGGVGRQDEAYFLTVRTFADAQAESAQHARKLPYWQMHPEFVARCAALAEDGQRLEPNNAFFPYLLACARLSQHRDGKALFSLKQAASCSQWDDCSAAEVQAQIALQTTRYGSLPSLAHVSIASAQYSPEGGLLTDAARVFATLAALREQCGDVQGGFNIRHDLAHIGALLRRDGTTTDASSHGQSLVALAAARPGGALPIRFALPDFKNKSNDERSRLAESRYTDYLNRNNLSNEARWYTEERARGREAKQITQDGFKESYIGGGPSVVWATVWMACCYILLANLTCVLTAGGIAHLAGRGARAGDAAALPPAIHRAVTNLVALPFWISFIVGIVAERGILKGVMLSWLAFALAATVLAAPVLYWKLVKREEATRCADTRRDLALYGKTLLVGLPALFVVMTTLPTVVLVSLLVTITLRILVVGDHHTDPTAQAAWFLAFVSFAASAGLILVVARSLWRSLRRKTPASVGLALDIRRASVPLATGLLLSYAGALVTLSIVEGRAQQDVAAYIAHQCRFFARQEKTVWPDLVPETKFEGVRP